MKKFSFVLLAISAFIGVHVLLHAPGTKASFNANNLMSDSVFDNSSTMNAAQIDSWLNSTWPNSCLSTRNGFSAPDPAGYNPSAGFIYGGNVSAGKVIYDAAQAYNLNPEVLLATLEKESSVVSGDASYHCQYINTAMGFDCPDSGSCPQNPVTESGFSQQIIHAAWLLKYSEQRSEGNVNFNIQKPGWDNSDDPPSCYAHLMTQGARARSTSSAPCPTSSSPPGNQAFYYDGYTVIDGSTIHLDNGATAALYDYTPHFHGNQNFVSIFEQTFGFGSTQAIPGDWQDLGQNIYTDSARTIPANPGILSPNTTYYLQLKALNTGNSTWSNSGSNPVLLATSNPGNRSSAFCDGTWWNNCSRAAALVESTVEPGQTGTFNFSIHTPSSDGVYNEYFNLVSEGSMWMRDIGLHWQFGVKGPTYAWAPQSQQIATDSGQTTFANPNILSPNTTYYLQLKAMNIGNTTWTNNGSNPVLLGTSNPVTRSSAFCTNTWVGTSCNRPATLMEASVAPGSIGTFSFSIKTPNSFGTFKEYFDAVSEGNMWMNDVGQYWQLTTKPPTAQWQYQGQSAYTDSSKATPMNLSSIPNNTKFYVTLNATNTGNTTWTNTGGNPVRLGTSSPNDRTSTFCDNSTWITCDRSTVLEQSSVAPGQTGTFDFWMQSPYSTNGTSTKEYFQPVVEGSMWMNDVGLYWPVTFQSPVTSWQYIGQSSFSDSSRTTPVDLTNATTNTTYYLELKAKNTSGVTWTNSGANPLRLGTPNNQTSVFCDNTWIGSGCNRPATLKEPSVAPGQTGTFDFSIKTPSTPSSSNLYLRPVIEGQNWLDDLGLYWPVTTH